MKPPSLITGIAILFSGLLNQGCSSKKPTFFPEGNGVFWIEYTHGGPHWAMCGPYRDSDSYRFEFKDGSNSYSSANMNMYVNSATVKSKFEGTIVLDSERQTATVAIFLVGENGPKRPLPINGRYPIKEKK